MNAFK